MDIVGNTKITLRSGTGKYPLTITFSAATAATTNDGSLPHGTTITSTQATIADSTGADILTQTIDTLATDPGGLQITLLLDYPPLAAKGKCLTMLILTLSNGGTIVKRWDGLYIE